MKTANEAKCDVSIIIPIFNGSEWINKCFESLTKQTAKDVLSLEVCVCNDASTDTTADLLEEWRYKFNEHNINLVVYTNKSDYPKGVGFAKNKAVSICNGEYLCFQDVDDVMLPDRILCQYKKALDVPENTLIGSRFRRVPSNSTMRYTKWANSLTEKQLTLQIYTSNGPTIIMPTWFCSKSVYQAVGGFVETGKGTPEDLIFFYKHLDLNGAVCRLDEVLLEYYYHPSATSFTINQNTIWDIRMERIQRVVLNDWNCFTIWNAGKQGRKFYRSLSQENKYKVLAFCDVDIQKIGRKYVPFNKIDRQVGCSIDIVHFKDAKRPFIICVKLEMTNGQFEKYLNSLQIQEGKDYIVFS